MNQQKNLNPLDSLPLADILFVKDKRISLFLELSQVERTDLIRRVTKTVKTDILNRIPEYDLVKIIEMVDPDEATDNLQILHKAKRDRVLGKLADEIKSSLSTLLEFDPKTAAGLMTLDYIQMEISDSVAAVFYASRSDVPF